MINTDLGSPENFIKKISLVAMNLEIKMSNISFSRPTEVLSSMSKYFFDGNYFVNLLILTFLR